MRLPRLLLFLSIILSAASASASAKEAEAARAYKGAIVMDAATGQVLFEDHADEIGPPASVTKLMTFLIVQDHIASGALTLQTPVTVTREDARVGGTQVWLKENEVFPVEELLFALMIQSANDAASALAHTVGGSREAFVELMNAKARELGMTHTTFHSPHGLPPSRGQQPDLTSPHDLALLSRYLLLHTDILRYTSVHTRPFGTGVRLQTVVMTNHNHLLGHINGCDGLKTGFTNGAGFCLAATAQRGSHRIIVVVMGSSQAKTRDLKVAELIEKGFTQIPPGSAFAGYTPPATETATPGPIAAPPATSPVAPVETPATAPATPAPSPVTPAPLSPAEKTSDLGATDNVTVKFSDPAARKKG
ncbi:MAG TPA: D-alanyl-D-alanine carboxypeptidase family protein [Opitutaceae bacterium]|jgi:D-alanyl-D-alanine carboxypeptidase|nr:D-alanyl-D-alanine carboxypeptidase family protein [Opitutaceae bacterium]